MKSVLPEFPPALQIPYLSEGPVFGVTVAENYAAGLGARSVEKKKSPNIYKVIKTRSVAPNHKDYCGGGRKIHIKTGSNNISFFTSSTPPPQYRRRPKFIPANFLWPASLTLKHTLQRAWSRLVAQGARCDWFCHLLGSQDFGTMEGTGGVGTSEVFYLDETQPGRNGLIIACSPSQPLLRCCYLCTPVR